MAYRPGGASEEDVIRGAAQRLRDLRQHLGFPKDAGGRNIYDTGVPYNIYMRRLHNDLKLPRGGPIPNEDDSVSRALADFGDMIRDGAQDVRSSVEAEFRPDPGSAGDVVCCIVNALYEFAKRQDLADDIESAREYQVAYEGTVRDWVRLLREVLVSARQVMLRDGVSAGRFEVQLDILKVDITDILKEAAEAGIAGLLFAIVTQISQWAKDVDDEITSDIQSTRCLPLMRIWASVYDTLFHTIEGLIARVRSYFRSVFVRSARRTKSIRRGIGRDFDTEAKLNAYVRWTTDLIDILDAILAALSIFEICRVDRYVPSDEEGDQGRSDQPDRPGRDPVGDPAGDPVDNPRAPTETPSRSDPDRRDPRENNRGRSRGRGQGSQDEEFPDASSYRTTTQYDPDLGRISVLDTEDADDGTLYFTPLNRAKLLIEAFDVPPGRALELADRENCAEAISDETADLLNEVGIPT